MTQITSVSSPRFQSLYEEGLKVHDTLGVYDNAITRQKIWHCCCIQLIIFTLNYRAAPPGTSDLWDYTANVMNEKMFHWRLSCSHSNLTRQPHLFGENQLKACTWRANCTSAPNNKMCKIWATQTMLKISNRLTHKGHPKQKPPTDTVYTRFLKKKKMHLGFSI